MKLTEEELKELMQEQSARSTRRGAGCLTEDQLARAATGEMNREERMEIANHMVSCADCVEEYKIARSLKPWSEEAALTLAAPVPPQAAKYPITLAEEKTKSPQRRFISLLSSPGMGLALAASLLIMLTLGGWLILSRQEHNRQIAQLNERLAEQQRALQSAQESLDQTRRQLEETERLVEQQKQAGASEEEIVRLEEEIANLRLSLRELSDPNLDAPIIDLDPGAVRGGGSGKSVSVDVPKGARFLTLILNFTGESRPEYEVEIVNRQGRRVWTGRRVRKSEARSLNLTLSRRSIPEGEYVIRLYGLRDGEKELLADYSVLVNYR